MLGCCLRVGYPGLLLGCSLVGCIIWAAIGQLPSWVWGGFLGLGVLWSSHVGVSYGFGCTVGTMLGGCPWVRHPGLLLGSQLSWVHVLGQLLGSCQPGFPWLLPVWGLPGGFFWV